MKNVIERDIETIYNLNEKDAYKIANFLVNNNLVHRAYVHLVSNKKTYNVTCLMNEKV